MSRYHSLQRLLKIIGENTTPNEMFTSNTFYRNIKGLCSLVSGRYNTVALIPQIVWDKNEKTIARTNNDKIFINTANSLTEQLNNFEDKYISVIGILGHELGHVLYTDFVLLKSVYENIINKGWLIPPCNDNDEEKLKNNLKRLEAVAFMNEAAARTIINILQNINNILEDIYVNTQISYNFPGTFKGGIVLAQKIMWGNGEFKYIYNDVSTCINSIYYVCVFGSKKLPPKLVQDFPEILDIERETAEIRTTTNPRNRILMAERCLLYVWPYIEKAITFIETPGTSGQGGKGQSNGPNFNEQSEVQSSGQMSGNITITRSSGNGRGNSQPISKEMTEKIKKALEKQLKDVKGSQSEGTGRGLLNQNDNSSEKDQKSGKKSGNDDQTDVEGKNDQADTEGKKNKSDNGNPNNNKESKKNEAYNNDNEKTEKQKGPQVKSTALILGQSSGEIEEPELKTIDTLLSEYSKELLRDKREKVNQITRKVIGQEVAANASHNGVRFKINTFIANTDKANTYNKVFEELRPYSKRLQKDILEAIKDKKEGTTCSGLLRGKRIDSKSVGRNDGKIFKDNKLPDDEAELVVSLLIDQSGSMSGEKIAHAMKTAMVIEDFCRGIGIPVSIMGHCVAGQVILNQYIDFDDDSPNRKYKICELYSSGCNRDGFALRYCIKQLEHREEPTKLMILISDGLPNDNGYCKNVAKRDLQECVSDCRKKNIVFFAAAIDQDKEQIRDIYGSSFLDITDLATFPKKMVNLIKRFVVE